MITYIIFAHTSLYVMILQVGKICVSELTATAEISTDPDAGYILRILKCIWVFGKKRFRYSGMVYIVITANGSS